MTIEIDSGKNWIEVVHRNTCPCVTELKVFTGKNRVRGAVRMLTRIAKRYHTLGEKP